ncbi:ankyrin repeat-containing domain protein [Aspergillus spectabilis]
MASAYQEFHTCTDAAFESRKILNTDRAPLYETEHGSLLRRIIARNDVHQLKQYIAAWEWDLDRPNHGIPVPKIQSQDPFYIAAVHGSLDVLRVLLDIRSTTALASASAPIEEERGFSLLHVACQHAQIATVTFLLDLDSDPYLATLHDRDPGGWTPLMAAAYSTGAADAADRARGEALMQMLLDRGASARDMVPLTCSLEDIRADTSGADGGQLQPQQAESTVLSLAISRCSYSMVKQVLESGADAYQPLSVYSDGPGFSFHDDGLEIRDVTALHLGSAAWNVEGIKAILDYFHEHGNEQPLDLISRRDSMGRLPLHYAAAGLDITGILEPSLASENTLVQKITGTFQLLVPGNEAATASLINTRDTHGRTPLHYATQTHADCGIEGLKHGYHALAWLCSRGADASVLDGKGQTVLHILAAGSLDGEPIDCDVIQLLLTHSCPLDATDNNGDTALHILARHLRQAHTVLMLLNHGAKVDVINKSGNLALHEVMRGGMRPKERWDRTGQEAVSMQMRIEAQDGVVEALLEAHGNERVLNQPNGEGKTPRVLREETRKRWEGMRAKQVK